jgi:hypothetical protein
MTPNEAREILGLPQRPEGDDPFVMSGQDRLLTLEPILRGIEKETLKEQTISLMDLLQ